MNVRKLLLLAVIITVCLKSNAGAPLKDYSFIRGVCYPGGWQADQATIEKELGYAVRLNINSTRIWLNYRSYQRDPKVFIDKLVSFVRTSHKMGISTMPIFFNGNGLNPDFLKPEFKKEGDAYVKSIIDALKNEPGLLMWDIMNEPVCNDYYLQAPADQKEKRFKEIYDFVRYYLKKTKELDPVNAITVGVMYPQYLEEVADLCDVLSFHDYRETRAIVQAVYDTAKEISARHGNKPLINSEMSCIGRSNPYDMSIEMCEANGAGWYIFELMVHGYWGDVHGIVYPDGTVRDPSIIAALFGFYRNRDLNTIVKANPNKEGYAQRAITKIESTLTDVYKVFENRRASTDDILEAAEWAANLLEGAEMVPMNIPPTAKIQSWRAQPAAERDAEAIREFAYELALLLRKYCRIL